MAAQLMCHVQQFDSDLEIRNGIKLKWTFHQFEILLRTCQCYGHQLGNVQPREVHAADISIWYEFNKSHPGQEGMSKLIAWSLRHRTTEMVSYWMCVKQIIQEIQSLYDRGPPTLLMTQCFTILEFISFFVVSNSHVQDTKLFHTIIML